ncbi:PD-(D/E)XK nuclease family protein [Cellulosimicrobium funkei]|uniref:PD-(D/E)XK nuclease family protein n=1 Tax=Cellulosimicrobium funkei TaxID=264251 RepID=UPI0037DC9143
MSVIDASAARPPAVGDLSYSGWSRMRVCRLKAVFSMDERTRSLERGGVLAAIGNARHSLAELVEDGRRDGRAAPRAAWVRSQFDRLLDEERTDLQAQWAPAEVPPIRLWPDIALTKAKLARAFGSSDGAVWPDVASIRAPGRDAAPYTGQPAARQTPDPPEPGNVKVEITLRDSQRGLWGRIDRLENRTGTLTVVDLKSGIGVPHDQLADRHRTQMLYYAGLVQAAYDCWPALELALVDGSSVVLDYEPDEVEAVRAEAAEDRSTLNTAISRNTVRTDTQATVNRCAWCPFQVVCPALAEGWTSLMPSDGLPLHRAVSLVRGEVTRVKSHESSNELVIRQRVALTAPAGEVVVTRLPPGPWATPGGDLAVSRVAPSGNDSVLRATWDSLIWPEPVQTPGAISG